ncbi:hypothetical protein ACFOOM_01080 [Streptomyces echinoruber]|uniref:Uncharacterized protein n=1 Tax=Streptomyces echinoruber TaxID=68898 RepID=A0A918QVG0_9ACTN|nr:hypothetical protein [Streptomyces echinoruber]GGZ73094.1 hypothetical protein GCM10010389_08180 [Streptomyces echinoruber]
MVTFATRVDLVPIWFTMPCIACEITGTDGEAAGLVSATSGLGLASCAAHLEITARVLRRLRSYELTGLRAAFVTAGITPEPQHDRGPGEDPTHGSSPVPDARDHSH